MGKPTVNVGGTILQDGAQNQMKRKRGEHWYLLLSVWGQLVQYDQPPMNLKDPRFAGSGQVVTVVEAGPEQHFSFQM